MNKILPLCIWIAALLLMGNPAAKAQQSLKSILINHGASSCGATDGQQQLFTGVLGTLPSILGSGSNGLPFYSSFVAYNPKDKKIYFADISNGNSTKMYAMDYNLGGILNFASIAAPTYTYNYGINQLCFDADGNNLAIYNYNSGTGIARVKRIDVATGNDIPGTDKQLNFPAGLAPNSLAWGDMVFMPNGRVFMTFGNSPSRLYELVNFDGAGDATAVYLTNIPHQCFSIGYVDGNLFVAGSDGSGCYYYIWDITGQTLSPSAPFPMGKSTADITHMNVGLGLSQELIGGAVINSNTADIIYHITVKNKGNIDLTNVQVKNALTDAFGFGNVSNVHASLVTNPAGLVLNPLYDGVLFTDLLLPGQNISNYPVSTDSAVIRIQLRATNLVPNQIYYSSATGSGLTGAGLNVMYVKDSSNNGDATMIDVDGNGVSDDANEGIPTPFQYNVLLPLSNLNLSANLQNEDVTLHWTATNEAGLTNYELQRSADGVNYATVHVYAAKNISSAYYQGNDDLSQTVGGTFYYRLKVDNNKGTYSYSNAISVQVKSGSTRMDIYPNPFVSNITIQAQSPVRATGALNLYDVTGKMIIHRDLNLQAGLNSIRLDQLQELSHGTYFVELINGGNKTRTKVVK